MIKFDVILTENKQKTKTAPERFSGKTEKAMKTKNNVQKAILRTGAVIISFVLISFTVSAQEFWKRIITNSSFNEIAVAMIETKEEAKLPEKPDVLASEGAYIKSIYEPELTLENWMINESYFYFDLFEIQNESDNPLSLENWMVDYSTFSVLPTSDELLQLEDWMVSSARWGD